MARTAFDLLREDQARSLRVAGTLALAAKENRAALAVGQGPTSLLSLAGFQSKSGAAVNDITAFNVSTVFSCVQLISGVIARLPKRLIDKTATGFSIIDDHPSCQLVQKTPDGFRTSFAFWQAMETIALLRGNSPVRIIRNAYFEPVKLGWMNPYRFEVWRTEAGDPFYRYDGQILQPFEVLNHKELSTDGISGISTISAMREQIGMAITTQEHGSRFFANGAAPGLVLTAPIGATEQQMNRIRDEVAKNHGGVSNANKPFIAYGGLTVSTVELSNADSQFLESRRFDVEEIARAFRVPPHLVGATDKSTSFGAGIEQQNRAFIDFSLADRLARREGELDMALLTQADRDAGLAWKYDTSELTRGTAKERAERFQIMRNIGAYCVDDVRREEGLNDLPNDAGKDYSAPFNGNGGTNANAVTKPETKPAAPAA